MIKKNLMGIVGLLSIIGSVIVFFVAPSIKNVYLELYLSLVGWILFTFQFFYDKSESFYIFANNFLFWISNGSTKWDFTVDLLNPDSSISLDEIWRYINQIEFNSRKWHLDNNSLIVNFPGYTLKISINLEFPIFENEITLKPGFTIQVSNLELPFRTSTKKINTEIIPLIRQIVGLIKPSEEKYVVKIGFSNKNPYFGFFVRKLDLPCVTTFNCEFIDKSLSGSKSLILVEKDKLIISSQDILSLSTLSNKYISLSWGDYVN